MAATIQKEAELISPGIVKSTEFSLDGSIKISNLLVLIFAPIPSSILSVWSLDKEGCLMTVSLWEFNPARIMQLFTWALEIFIS